MRYGDVASKNNHVPLGLRGTKCAVSVLVLAALKFTSSLHFQNLVLVPLLEALKGASQLEGC